MGHNAPDCDSRVVQQSLVKVKGVILCPVPKILLVYSTGQMEIGLIAAPQNNCGRNVLKNILT
jgi:hypothetical protein